MPQSLLIPLTGSFYHPPAQLIIPLLAVGTKLNLVPDVHNYHDRNAIAVWFDLIDFDISQLSGEALMGMGLVHEDLERVGTVQLGWVARQASPEHPRGPAIGNTAVLKFMRTHPAYTTSLAFTIDGKPAVRIQDGVPE